MMMKILIINNIFLGTSGGDYHVERVSKEWAKSHRVLILKPEIDKLAYSIAFLQRRVSIFFAIAVCYIVRILRALMRQPKEQFDVIVSSSHYPPDLIPVLFFHFRNPNAKIIAYLHGFFPEIPHRKVFLRIPSLLYNYLGFLMMRRIADIIFVFNRHTYNLLIHTGFDYKKVFLTSNGVDVATLNIVNDKKLFDACFLGRLVENKGIPDLVKVWKLVCRSRKDAKLAVIGSGPQEKLLDELATRENLKNNIILFGFVPEGRKYEVLQNSKVFVFPSYLEGWGIAVAEAMVCGLPVVAYNLPIYKEVFDDKLITVPLGDVEEMARKVIYLLENPEIARKIGEEGREFVKRYDWSVVAERELSVIQATVQKH
jgi:glycosyltransferase involved in cell wall biosynthesis